MAEKLEPKSLYKVFIDHKPMVFMDKESCKDEKFVKWKELPKSKNDLKPLLKESSLDQPLIIRCGNVEKAFSEYFEEYSKITAAGGIVQRKKKFLVIKRNGLWDIPKGKVEKGEDIEEGAVREIEEECGIDGPVIERFLTKTYHVFNHKGSKAIKTTYWYLMNYEGDKETTPQLKEGITKAKWMTFDEMLAIRGNTYGSINELLDVFEAQLAD